MEEHPTNEENMEVHKHSHHVMHKKKWPEYLLEFVMLFLAVFLGFLAENIRENSVERQRAKEYIFSFYEDLKKDIATFSRISAFDDLKEAELKNIFCCYDTLSKNWKNTSCLIPLINNSRTNYSIAFSNGTLQQLKNAGGFRLLGIDDRDTIMSYDHSIQNYENFEATFFQQSQDNVRNTLGMLSDFNSNRFLYPAVAGADSSNLEMPLLFSDNKELLNLYFNDLFIYRTANNSQLRQLKLLKDKALSHLNYFKSKYSII